MSCRSCFPRTDVVVIGGGPAGCAAAITAHRAGARVILLERDRVARDRPGETLHPGIEPLLTWLGAGDLLRPATLARHEGHWVQVRGDRQFVAFGGDESGTWRGFQARRQTLDGSLRQRAADLGVEVRLGAAVGILRSDAGRVTGVVTADGQAIATPVLVDASGGRHWLARQLHMGVTRLSPRYVASFGYVLPDGPGSLRRRPPPDPELSADPEGWTWIAPLGSQGWHWTRLSFAGRRTARRWLPPALGGLQPRGVSRGADVTWRMARSVAGPGWLVVGDAGAVLDPASSHGVLRALMSGARAGTLAARGRRGPSAESDSFAEFDAWFQAGVHRDAITLRASYAAWCRPGRTKP